ncbi:MAG TPA: class I tRNA ligase family protein, partial [Pseudoclavibacter sp.]|nr:class I tRNA ligase family protein [Pseudoclavibacter sp.]
RYYFMRAITLGSDGSFSWEDIHARYHAELANGLGNLGSRVIAMVQKYFGGVVPVADAGEPQGSDNEITALAARVSVDADAAIERIAPHEAIAAIWELVDALNGYVTEQEPWALAKAEDHARLARVLDVLVQGVATLSVLLEPVMPESMQTLWHAIGGAEEVSAQNIRPAAVRHELGAVSTIPPLFPRVDDDAVPATPVPQR